MSPSYGPYQSLEHYLQARARDFGHNLTSLSEELGFARSYLNSIATEQFRPSIKRCRLIAEFLGDDPDIILALAGFREPPLDDQSIEAIGRLTNSLSPHLQRTVLEFVSFLNSRQAARQESLKPSQIYIELPDGQGMTLEVEGDPLALSMPVLRLTIRAAMNAALADRQEKAKKQAEGE